MDFPYFFPKILDITARHVKSMAEYSQFCPGGKKWVFFIREELSQAMKVERKQPFWTDYLTEIIRHVYNR